GRELPEYTHHRRLEQNRAARASAVGRPRGTAAADVDHAERAHFELIAGADLNRAAARAAVGGIHAAGRAADQRHVRGCAVRVAPHPDQALRLAARAAATAEPCAARAARAVRLAAAARPEAGLSVSRDAEAAAAGHAAGRIGLQLAVDD